MLQRRGRGNAGRDAAVFLERRRGEEEEGQFLRHGARRHLAEQTRLFGETLLGAAVIARADGIECREQRRIMAARLLHRHFASLTEHHRATDRIVLEHHFLRAVLLLLVTTLAGRDLARPLDRHVTQDARMHELVDQADLQRLLGAHILAGENHVERTLQPDRLWQSLRSAGAGNQAKLHFGERKDGLRMFRSNAIRARERRFETATEARAVDRRNNRRA
jgi:hypothetical protein